MWRKKGSHPFGFEDERATQFALDLGGILELYPFQRTIVRFNLSATIVRYPGIQVTQVPLGTADLETLYTPVNYNSALALVFVFKRVASIMRRWI